MEAFSWELISLLTAILSAIFNGCGLFTTEWWIGDGVKYGLFTRVTCRDHLCVLPTDDTASMYLLFTVFLSGWHVGTFFCVVPTDDTASKYSLFTVLFTRVTCRDYLCMLPTDDIASMYLLFTVLLPG